MSVKSFKRECRKWEENYRKRMLEWHRKMDEDEWGEHADSPPDDSEHPRYRPDILREHGMI